MSQRIYGSARLGTITEADASWTNVDLVIAPGGGFLGAQMFDGTRSVTSDLFAIFLDRDPAARGLRRNGRAWMMQ